MIDAPLKASRLPAEARSDGHDAPFPMRGESIVLFGKEWGEDRTSCDQVFEQLARHNKVLWVDSIATRNPNLRSAQDWRRIARKVGKLAGGLRQVRPTAWVYQPAVIPLPYSRAASRVNRMLLRHSLRRQMKRLGMHRPQLWSFLPNAAHVIGELNESVVVYYCVDAWSEFSFIRPEMIELERRLAAQADVCFATGQGLADHLRRFNPRTHLALHGVNHDHFSRALDAETPIPEDLARLPGPRIGFFGALHDWVDQNLLEALARAHPEWSIVLIGKEHVPFETLRRLPNVHLLGRRPYESLPGYCKGFDVALIPFVVNELTRHVNPIKLWEYLSAGVPVVSTDLEEVRRAGQHVHIGAGPGGFIDAIARALREDTPAHRRIRSDAMRRNTWEHRTAETCRTVLQIRSELTGRP